VQWWIWERWRHECLCALQMR